MPYIDPSRRDALEPAVAPRDPGELNFVVTRLADAYLAGEPLSYQRLNDVLGALEGAKLELYRRLAAPYEDRKREGNGDVYDTSPVAAGPRAGDGYT